MELAIHVASGDSFARFRPVRCAPLAMAVVRVPRFITMPDGEPGLNYLYAGYRAFFNRVNRPMQIMAYLIHDGRYANEVMRILDCQETALMTAVAKTIHVLVAAARR